MVVGRIVDDDDLVQSMGIAVAASKMVTGGREGKTVVVDIVPCFGVVRIERMAATAVVVTDTLALGRIEAQSGIVVVVANAGTFAALVAPSVGTAALASENIEIAVAGT